MRTILPTIVMGNYSKLYRPPFIINTIQTTMKKIIFDIEESFCQFQTHLSCIIIIWDDKKVPNCKIHKTPELDHLNLLFQIWY